MKSIPLDFRCSCETIASFAVRSCRICREKILKPPTPNFDCRCLVKDNADGTAHIRVNSDCPRAIKHLASPAT